MLPPLKSLSVNWVDGMKINKDHFEQSDLYTKELVRDSTALFLNDYNYGLCPAPELNGNPLNLIISIDPAKIIRVQLISCRAVTPGGSRIEFGLNQQVKLNTESDKLAAEYNYDDSKDKNFYILIGVNILAKVPTGQPENDEVPPRFPFVMPEYHLQILPESQMSFSPPALNSVVIGSLNFHSGKMKEVDNFIPPCMQVASYPPLLNSYFKLGNLMGETGKNVAVILDKIHGKSQSTSLVKSCSELCYIVSDFISDNLGTYRWIYSNQPPVFMLDCFLKLAYKISMTLSNLPVKDKEELVNYICEWIDEGPSEINEKINNLIKSEYSHANISATLTIADNFMQLVHSIFYRLAQLDFIGKKKGERAFVQEKPVVTEALPQQKSDKGWSFLAE